MSTSGPARIIFAFYIEIEGGKKVCVVHARDAEMSRVMIPNHVLCIYH